MNLFETWTGADFLAFYAVMLLTCAGLSLWIPANLRGEGRLREVEDPEEIAVLSGGPQRFTLAVLADLLARGGVAPADKSRVEVTRTDIEAGRAGKAILRKVGAFGMREATLTLKNDADRIAQDLARRGLLLGRGELSKLRWLSIAPFALLFVIGLYRQQAGAAEGEPTGFLIAFLALTAVCAVMRFATISQTTHAGQKVLQNWIDRSSRLRRAPEGGEVKLAVGLFGSGVLAGTPFAHVHAMRQSNTGGDGGSSSDGGGDGGGGCGGGCGGCGG